MTGDIVTMLRAALPAPGIVLDHTDDLARHLNDFTPRRATTRPLAVVYTRDSGDVASVLRLANMTGTPVVAQGGLTGMTGGAVPGDGAIVLSLEKMRAIVEVDLDASAITVEAGVTLEAAQRCAAEAGRLLPLDLGARGSCTIGGNLATNAGGNRVLRYGMTRDLVLGLEVVLADGTIISNLNKMIKNNAGYDLRQLFIGSEGTLGVITKAVLRLFPMPRTTNAALLAVRDFPSVVKLLHHVRAGIGPHLSAFEAMWPDFYAVASQARSSAPLQTEADEIVVLLDMLGNDEERDGEWFVDIIADAVEKGLVRDAVIAKSNADIDAFWRIRDTSGELGRVWSPCLNFDVSVPIGEVGAWVEDCRRRLDAAVADADPLFFGHVADSNLHVACRCGEEPGRRTAIERAVYGSVAAAGGSISAEHGIGLDKRDYLSLSRSEDEIALMWRLKQALDPKGILNPGKVLPITG